MTQKPEKAVNVTETSKFSLLLRTAISIFLLDRWIIQPLKTVANRKGPLIVFGARRQRKRKGANVKKHLWWIIGGVLIVGAGVWYFLKGNWSTATNPTGTN